MPLVRITLAKGKSPEYLKTVSDTIYSTMLEHFVLAEGDKFHIFEQLEPGAFIYDPDYAVEESRTDDFMIIQIIADARRAVEKAATIKALCENLGTALGVKSQDIVVVLSTNSTLEDFSLGHGISATTAAAVPA